MKTTTTYKLRLIERALKEDIAVSVLIRGDEDMMAVKVMQNQAHTVLFTLDRNGGYLAVDPDDIISVWVPKLPRAFDESHPHA